MTAILADYRKAKETKVQKKTDGKKTCTHHNTDKKTMPKKPAVDAGFLKPICRVRTNTSPCGLKLARSGSDPDMLQTNQKLMSRCTGGALRRRVYSAGYHAEVKKLKKVGEVDNISARATQQGKKIHTRHETIEGHRKCH